MVNSTSVFPALQKDIGPSWMWKACFYSSLDSNLYPSVSVTSPSAEFYKLIKCYARMNYHTLAPFSPLAPGNPGKPVEPCVRNQCKCQRISVAKQW